MSFSYYVYVSDSKIDMLLPQIDPRFGAKRQTELGVNLTVLSAKRTTEGPSNDRIGRLETVVGYLRDHGDLGSVDEPGQFFWGLLPMRWGRSPPIPRPRWCSSAGGARIPSSGWAARTSTFSTPCRTPRRTGWGAR